MSKIFLVDCENEFNDAFIELYNARKGDEVHFFISPNAHKIDGNLMNKLKEKQIKYWFEECVVDEDNDWDKYYKKQRDIEQTVYKDLTNIVKRTRFIKEKKRYELYMVETEYMGEGWSIFIPQEMEYALYDPKIEKYLEDNIKFVEEYDRSSEATFF